MQEKWVNIEEYFRRIDDTRVGIGSYSVSTCGYVRNNATNKVLTPRLDEGKYHATVKISWDTIPLARVVLTVFVEAKDGSWCPGYRDGDHRNCRLDNLFWQRKSAVLGRKLRLRVTPEQVTEIRLAYQNGSNTTELANKYSVKRQYIYDILRGRVGRILPGPIFRNIRPRNACSAWAKLSDDKAKEIRQLIAEGSSVGEVAEAYGVSERTIISVARGWSWRWVNFPTVKLEHMVR